MYQYNTCILICKILQKNLQCEVILTKEHKGNVMNTYQKQEPIMAKKYIIYEGA